MWVDEGLARKKTRKTHIYSLLLHHEFNLIFHTQLMGFLIPPSYSEVSIGDTQEHPLGVYLEKELLYFNIT